MLVYQFDKMSVRVGTIKGANDRLRYKDYKTIVCLTKSTAYGDLGPYVLKDDQGVIIENRWQFSKVYADVPKTKQYYSQWDNTVVWDHPAEHHVDEKEDEYHLLDKYWKWREKGFKNEYFVRYPVGKSNMGKCLFSLDDNSDEALDYVQARKKIYWKYYKDAVIKQPKFKKLKKMLKEGQKPLIVEVDGPRQESLDYYIKKYKVPKNWIENKTIEVNEENMKILVNDTTHCFGHGFCLASALLNIDIEQL